MAQKRQIDTHYRRAGAKLPILRSTLGLAAALWVVILAVFFPIVGWGFAGLAISPKLIVASAVPHLLFGLLLWGLDHYFARSTPPE